MTTATKMAPAPRWDLDSIFPGGSQSSDFRKFRDELKTALTQAEPKMANLPKKLDDSSRAAWKETILNLQTLLENIELVLGLGGCLAAADVNDGEAQAIENEGDLFLAQWQKMRSTFEAIALEQADAEWEKLMQDDQLKPIRFYLDEMRTLAKRKMPVHLESLALELAVNGYHAWNRLYDKMAGDLRVDFEDNGKSETLSLGQLATKVSDPRREIREQAFEKMTAAWESRADLAAMALNSQAGFRLDLYNRRGWDSALYEPLSQARLSQDSLDAMWRVIARESHRLQPYIDAKKKLLGIDKYRWYDESVPCGQADKLWDYREAAEFIIRGVGTFSDDLAQFCRMAIDKNWIEAEDRAGKRGGGFCTSMGPKRQSRIFMTYAGTFDGLLTLAHELGHAYHSNVLKNHPFFATDYPMTLAETASIFNELLVTDAALEVSNDPQEKIMLIDQKLQQAYVFFCNIQARYLFDKSFYEERSKGVVPRARLSELMVEAQKKAYGKLLDETGYHPLFWASKLHFFITDHPFYNYPYTFGFLFAGGVYDRAKKEGKAFADKYRALLADTGSMTSEDVAKKHLGVNLADESFWNDAVSRSLSSVDQFVDLVG